jgi:outer membrane protein
MKKLIITLCMIATLGWSATSIAQMKVVKIGYINSLELLSLMPEVKVADASLEKLANDYDSQLQKMGNEYNAKIMSYQEKKQKNQITEIEEEVVIKEISSLEERIAGFQETAQKRVSEKKEELYKPIMKKAEDAISSVSKQKGYTLVLDLSYGEILYHEEADEIITDVCKQLGITYKKPE